MPKSDAQELGEWQAGVERKLEDLARNRLSNASLDGTTLWLKDAYGNRQASLGAQGDGSSGVRVVKVQPPPQLTAPILTVGDQAGTCLCEWDGNTFDGRIMPLIHGHTEIWALHVGEDWDPTVAPPDGAKRVGTIRDRTGGEVVIALPQFGIWAVWLRAMGADRKTVGTWSPVSTVEIAGNVDVEAIEQELQDARDRLEAAEAKAADAMQRVTDLGVQWDEADFPQLKVDLEQAQQAVADAEVRLDAAEQGVADSQAGLVDLRDNRLPALRGDLDSVESAIADYDQRIIAAQAGADQANATANTLRDETLPALDDRLSGNEDEVAALTGTVLPALDSRLTGNETAISDAENRLTDAEAEISGAKAGLDQVRDTDLPALESSLSGAQSAIADHDQRITQARSAAQQAQDSADDLAGNVLPALDDRIAGNTAVISGAQTRLTLAEQNLANAQAAVDTVRNTDLPALNDALNTGLAGANEWRDAGSAVRVGDYENRLPEVLIEELRDQGTSTGVWGGSFSGWRTIANQGHLPISLRWNGGPDERLAFLSPSGRGIPVHPGDEFFMSWHGWMAPGAIDGTQSFIRPRFVDADLNFVSWGPLKRFAIGTADDSFSWVVPDNDAIRYMEINFEGRGDSSQRGHWGDFLLRQKATADLLVDGAVRANHIVANEIAAAVANFITINADQITGGQIGAGQINTAELIAEIVAVIELDASRITSGQISTSRLDAEEVAGAVANFLTLDALEINVEQLAGEIANIIEISAENIAANSISTHHLAIGDFTTLFPESALWDFHERGFASGAWLALQSGAQGWTTIEDQEGIPVLVRYNESGHSGTSRMVYRPGGTGIPVAPGDSFLVKFRAWQSSIGTGELSVSLTLRDSSQAFVTRVATSSLTSGWNEYERTVTIPEGSAAHYMEVDFSATPGAARGHIGLIDVRRMSDGKLIVDGSIQGRHVEAESVAAAVGQFLELHANQIAAGVIQAEQIDTSGLAVELATIISLNANRITSGTISTARLNAEQIAAAVGQFLSINAGAITSGTIDTARLNVQHLAGEIAQFLNITAEHIDAGSIAGAIANVLEITAENIAARAISTRHLAIGDFDNLFPLEAIEDLFQYGDNQSPWSRIRGTAGRWRTIANQGRGMPGIRIEDGSSGDSRSTLEYRPGEYGVPIGPGERIRLSFYGWAGGSGNAPSIALKFRDTTGSYVSIPDSVNVQSGWNEYALEAENTSNSDYRLSVEFDVSAGQAMRGHWQDFRLRHMTGGELIVDGAVRARHVVAEEIAGAVGQFLELTADQITAGTIQADRLNVSDLAARIANVIQLNASRITAGTLNANRININSLFANSAFINSLAARVIETLQVTAERGFIGGALLEDDSITVEKLYALDEIMSELGRFLKIEAGSLASNDIESMRIVSALIEASVYLIHDANGDVSVRLDGMNNFFRGALHAGVGADSEIHLDYGSKTRRRGLDQEGEPNTTWSVQTPYMDFRDERYNYRSDLRPSIHLDEGAPGESGQYDGMMVINPGYREDTPIYRGRLNVVGDVHANRFYSREWMETNRGFSMANSNANLTTSLSQDPSGNTYLLGRHSGAYHSRQRDAFWQSDTYSLQAGARRVRSFTWGTVPPSGLRRPVLSAHSLTNGAMIAVNSHSLTSTGYSINEENIGPSQTSYYVHQIAIWV